jgi:hypothetical protein
VDTGVDQRSLRACADGAAFFTASYGAIGLALAYILYSMVKGGLLYRYGRLALEEPRTQACSAVPVAP